MKRIFILLLSLLFLLGACTVAPTDTPVTDVPTEVTEDPTPTREVITPVPTDTPTDEPTPEPSVWDVDRMRFSFNINCEEIPQTIVPPQYVNGRVGVSGGEYLEYVIQELNPTYVLCMGNIPYAKALDAKFPNTRVIYRDWSRREGDEWKDKSPQEFVDKWKAYNAPNLIYYTTNEPSFGYNFSQLDEFVAHLAETIRLAAANRLYVGAGNFATGVIQPQWIMDGVFDPALEACRDAGEYCIWTSHEYTILTAPFGVGQWSLECLQDPACVQPSNWAGRDQLPLDYWELDTSAQGLYPYWSERYQPYGMMMMNAALGNRAQAGEKVLPPYWHLRRSDWFILRARDLPSGGFHLRVVLTEWFLDNMDDVKPSVYNLRLKYGDPRYSHDFRGVNTVEKIYREFYYPQWTLSEALFEQIKWSDRIYPNNYEGFMIFTWSNNPLWRQTDASGDENPELYNLHLMMTQYSSATYPDG